MIESGIADGTIYSTLAVDPCMGELVELYVEEMPARIAALKQAFSSGARDALRSAAHQMKGAAGSYGFESLTLSAAVLETAVRNQQSPETIQQAFCDLIQLCERIRAGIAPATV